MRSRNGSSALQQHPIPVRYRERLVGDFFADLLVENRVIVELKRKFRQYRKRDSLDE